MTAVMMTYHAPGALLSGLVDHIYVFRAAVDLAQPAGALLGQLCWTLRGRFMMAAPGGSLNGEPAMVIGPAAEAHWLYASAGTVVVGVGLFPEGWNGFIREPAHTLVGRADDLGAFWGGVERRLLEVDPSLPDPVLAGLLADMLRRRVLATPFNVDRRLAGISVWTNGRDHDPIELKRSLDLSYRQISRLALAAHGLPPRLLMNKHRALRAAAALASGRVARRDIWTAQFADQAHFIRQFRRFVGQTPGEFASHNAIVSDAMAARHRIRSDHPLGLRSD